MCDVQNEVVVKQGDMGDEMFFIAKGTLEVRICDGDLESSNLIELTLGKRKQQEDSTPGRDYIN